ncbi:hypothetical protein ACFV90_31430 [Streptomyces sp. NPDC059904]|uniref:hypothetical protein n=1 Tax=Streptomyces sp. NPDC059904 TaxID=3346996 RepID=UPI0036487582
MDALFQPFFGADVLEVPFWLGRRIRLRPSWSTSCQAWSSAADLGARLCAEDEAGQGLRPPKGRTWGRRGHTPVVRVTAAGTKRVSMAALICTNSGH